MMVMAAGLSCLTAVFISGYSCLTLTYGEDDEDVFHHRDSPKVVITTHTHTQSITVMNGISGWLLSINSVRPRGPEALFLWHRASYRNN